MPKKYAMQAAHCNNDKNKIQHFRVKNYIVLAYFGL